MIDYGKQRSTVEPLELEFTETMVFVSSNIIPVNEPVTEEQLGFVGWEFDMIEYTKDEYIKIHAEKNTALEQQVTDTQLALCEVYELMG